MAHDSKATRQTELKLAVITCDVLRDEIDSLAAGMGHVVCIHRLQQGLHNDPPELRSQLQQAIDHVEVSIPANAIALGYGLCSRGTEAITTRRCTLVLPRAHDCITLLLGDRHRYADYVAQNPGTYWYSPGWNRCHTPPGPQRHEKLLREYQAKYDPDDVQFLMDAEQHWFKTYNRATYVDLDIAVTEQDLQFTRDCARWLGWQFDRQHGDPSLLRDLLDGNWDNDRFLVLQPGQAARMTADEQIVTAVTMNNRPIRRIETQEAGA
jgi:hypothetical protein